MPANRKSAGKDLELRNVLFFNNRVIIVEIQGEIRCHEILRAGAVLRGLQRHGAIHARALIREPLVEGTERVLPGHDANLRQTAQDILQHLDALGLYLDFVVLVEGQAVHIEEREGELLEGGIQRGAVFPLEPGENPVPGGGYAIEAVDIVPHHGGHGRLDAGRGFHCLYHLQKVHSALSITDYLAPCPAQEHAAGCGTTEVGTDTPALAGRQLREGRGLIQEPAVKGEGVRIGLALVEGLGLCHIRLGGNLHLLVRGLDDTRVGYLEGNPLADAHARSVGQHIEERGVIQEGLVGLVLRQIYRSVRHQPFHLIQKGIPQDEAQGRVLGFAQGRGQVLPGQVVGDTQHLPHAVLVCQ